ncbi:MAG TPA: PIG-L family deacetylase [Phenylobacterium sp.]|jgi:LmbE family N-acetylglucosaminyl deacetylase
MSVVYVFAHFDDEFCALPLIRRAKAQGREQRFIHVVDYRRPSLAQRRRLETDAFLRREGLPPASELHLGAGTGWFDGELHRHAGAAYEALKAAVPGPIERVVTPAWEGGHPDHDICAALGVKLAAERGAVPVDQVCLYQGKGLPWLLYRASTPLPENGPAHEMRLSAREWASWLAGVTVFPSQLKAWSGLLPAMAMTFARQGDFRYQSLDPARIGERPHAGPLLYERMFKTPYPVVRAAVDRLAADGKAPWTPPGAEP